MSFFHTPEIVESLRRKMFAFDGGAGRGAATTKQVTRTDGTLEFVSYDEKIVLDCQQNALDKNTTTTTTPRTALRL